MRPRFSLPILTLALAAATALGQSFVPIKPGMLGGGGTQVKAEALLDTTALSPGKTAQLAVTLTTSPDFHIYWSNPGQGGVATSLHVEGPQDFKIEPLPFPIPHTFVQPGDITVFGYTGKTTFLFNITPPAGFTPSGIPPILEVSASWLNCNKDACTPGSAKLAVPITVGNGQPANAELFTAARDALPAEKLPPLIKNLVPIDLEFPHDSPPTHELGATIEWNQRYAPGRIEAFPEDLEGLHVDRIVIQPGGGNAFTRISLHAYAMPGYKLPSDHLNLIIAYDKPDPNNPAGRAGRGGPAWFAGADDAPGRRAAFILPIDLKPLLSQPQKASR
jgi:DsbC/DsbD-like thiol-disulfide interchange protein